MPYFMPNGVADPADARLRTDANGDPDGPAPDASRGGPVGRGRVGTRRHRCSQRSSPPAINGYVNLVQANYTNPVRAGYSYDITDILTRHASATPPTTTSTRSTPSPRDTPARLNDQDYYDAAGALILPVDRMRRYVTPADINGTGSVTTLDYPAPPGAGPTRWAGRASTATIRPPGSPGSIASSPSTPAATPPATIGTLGAIYYPSNATGNNFFYTNGPNNNPAPPAPDLHWPIRHTCPT